MSLKNTGSVEFKVKRRWWTCALFILLQILAVSSLFSKIYFLFYIILAADIFVILPDASHFRYILSDKFLTVKRILYPEIEIPLNAVTELNDYTLIATGGFALKIIEHTSGGYRIVYSIYRGKRKAVIISPKETDKFINEFCSRVDKGVDLRNNTESAFKKRKDNT